MRYVNHSSMRLEKRQKNRVFPTGTYTEKIDPYVFWHVVFIITINFGQKLNCPPTYRQTLAIMFLSDSCFFLKINPNVNCPGPCNASSRCEPSVKSIWDFQWTLRQVAMISKDYMSWAVFCPGPPKQHSTTSLCSLASKKQHSGFGVQAVTSVSAFPVTH